MSADFEYELRELARSLKKLKADQLVVARRNTRKAAIYRLGRIRRLMDEAFPAIVQRTRKPSSRGLSLTHRAARWQKKMQQRGFAHVMDNSLALAITRGGVKVYTAPMGGLWAPKWAILAAREPGRVDRGFNVAKVRQLKKSIRERRAFLAAKALGAGAQSLGV